MRFATTRTPLKTLLCGLLLLALGAGPLAAHPEAIPQTRVRSTQSVVDGFHVGSPHPNPFSRVTLLTYDLPESMAVRIELIDALGRRVRTLVNERKAAGRHQLEVKGEGLPNGLYLLEVEAGPHTETRRVTLVR